MKEGQLVPGIRITENEGKRLSNWRKNIASYFKTTTSKRKASEIHPKNAYWIILKGGPRFCIVYDNTPEGSINKKRATISCIEVDKNRIETGDQPHKSLIKFIEENWDGKLNIQSKPSTRDVSDIVSDLNIKLISTLIMCLDKGIDINSVEANLPNFRVIVELKMKVADILKDDEKFYEFLDEVNDNTKNLPCVGLKNSEVKEFLESSFLAVFSFMESRDFLKAGN